MKISVQSAKHICACQIQRTQIVLTSATCLRDKTDTDNTDTDTDNTDDRDDTDNTDTNNTDNTDTNNTDNTDQRAQIVLTPATCLRDKITGIEPGIPGHSSHSPHPRTIKSSQLKTFTHAACRFLPRNTSKYETFILESKFWICFE